MDSVRYLADSAVRQIGNESGHPNLAIKIGEVRQLGVFNETDSSVSILQESGVEATDGERKFTEIRGLATSFVLLNGKVVMLTAYGKVESDSDLEWLRSQSKLWTQNALKKNMK